MVVVPFLSLKMLFLFLIENIKIKEYIIIVIAIDIWDNYQDLRHKHQGNRDKLKLIIL